MYLAVDVNYVEKDLAVCSGVAVDEIEQCSASKKLTTIYRGKIEDYKPGEFCKREMPVLIDFFKKVDLRPENIIIDGLVYLPDGKKALGAYLKSELDEIYRNEGLTPPTIIGVAKNNYEGFTSLNKVYRGSIKPLIVTSSNKDVGISEIKSMIKNMAGKERIPSVIKEADLEGRSFQGDS